MTDDDALAKTKAVGSLVRNARVNLRMTQGELADASRFTRQTVGNLEVGHRLGKPFRTSASVLAAVSYAVEVTPEQLEDVDRRDAADLLRELIEGDLLAEEAERRRIEAVVIAGVRDKRAEFGTVGEFLGWVLVITGDVANPDA